MLGEFFAFELRYRARRHATYLYFALCFALGLLVFLTALREIGGGVGKLNVNAPTIVGQVVAQFGTIMGFFLFSAIMAVPVYRDFEHNTYTYLFAYPIKKGDYLGGRLLGSLLLAFVVICGFPLGMALGEVIARATADAAQAVNYGPFRAEAYFQPMLTLVLPNLLFLGGIYFTLPTLTRRIFWSYVLGIAMIVFYSITSSILQQTYDAGNKTIARLLDPFGWRAMDGVTEYWSVAEQNARIIPIEGDFLTNRLIWGAVGIALIVFCFLRFRFSLGEAGGGRRIKDEVLISVPDSPIAIRNLTLDFSWGARWAQFRSLLAIELTNTLRNPFFLVFMICIGLYVTMDAWFANLIYETPVHPTTAVMLDAKGQLFVLLMQILLVFLAGEVVWRERQQNLDQVYDAMPVQRAAKFWSKLLSLTTVPLALITLMLVVFITIQLIKGFTGIEFGLYFTDLFLVFFPEIAIIVIFIYTIQVVVQNKYVGHLMLVLYLVFVLVMGQLGLEHPLFRFGSGTGLQYSDLNGYGDQVSGHLTYLLHWSLVAGLLLSLGYGLFAHGTESGLRARIRELGRRWRSSLAYQVSTVVLLIGALGTGYTIYYATVEQDQFTGRKNREKAQVSYEKTYKTRFFRKPQPKITGVNFRVELYPDERRLEVSGRMWLRNSSTARIDTLLMEWRQDGPYTDSFSRAIIRAPQTEFERRRAIQRYAFPGGLAPGDSFSIDMTLQLAHTGLSNESGIQPNGTFINNGSFMPSIGYNVASELGEEDKRRENGLAEQPPLPDFTDSLAVNTGLFEQNSDWVDFEITIGTAADQVAVAPGYLKRQWQENGRAYFHYQMDRPMLLFFNIGSARYEVARDVFRDTLTGRDIAIEIYHSPKHRYNVQKMIDATKASLDYFTRSFGPYQHRQVRILEFPRTQGTFAQSFANTIPYSEGFGFIATFDNPQDLDYVWMVTSHEVAHQWWGHQVTPAAVRGGQFLSETMAEYSSLQVLKHQYGIGPLRKFLNLELQRYLSGRSGERRKESPLMTVEFQSYVYYRKGATAMFALQDYLGEDRFNAALKGFVRRYSEKDPPYPTMRNWYDAVVPIVPDSLREFFDDQMLRITLYENRVHSAKGKVLNKADSLYQVTLRLTTGKVYADSVGNVDSIPRPLGLPVDVGLLAARIPLKQADLLLLEKRYIPHGDTATVVLTYRGRKPRFAGIDPIHKLVDRKLEDNLSLITWED